MQFLFRFLLILTLLALNVWGERQFYRNDSKAIALLPVALDEAHAKRTRVGALEFLGGWQLTSENSDFGGFSALTKLPDGRFLAISDAGQMMGFALEETAGKAKLTDVFFAPLPGAEERESADGKPNYTKRDSEAVTFDPARRFYWVAYEYENSIRRFERSFVRVSAMARPQMMQKWPGNGGAEALVRLADGRFLVFAENAAENTPDGTWQLLLFSSDPTAKNVRVKQMAYRPPKGFLPTEASLLPGGQLLILNRAFGLPEGFSAALTIANLEDLNTQAILEAAEIARLEPPFVADNFEGMWTEKDAAGRTLIWLISDDNNHAYQRTLLLKFALDRPKQ